MWPDSRVQAGRFYHPQQRWPKRVGLSSALGIIADVEGAREPFVPQPRTPPIEGRLSDPPADLAPLWLPQRRWRLQRLPLQ